MAKKAKKEEPKVMSLEEQFKLKIQTKVQARQLGEATVASSASMKQVKQMPEYAKRSYLEAVAKGIGFDWEGMLDETRLVMSDEDAKAFSKQPIGFGKHQTEPHQDVPEDYLDWLADRCAVFLRWYRWFMDKKTR